MTNAVLARLLLSAWLRPVSRVWLGSLVVILAACGNVDSSSAEEQPAPFESHPGPVGASALRVENLCQRTDTELLIHAAIPVETRDERERTLARIICTLADGSCDGVVISLFGIDRGQPLTMSDFGSLAGGKIVSLTGSVAVLKWGARVFMVDFRQGTVRYTESAGDFESRGESSCSN